MKAPQQKTFGHLFAELLDETDVRNLLKKSEKLYRYQEGLFNLFAYLGLIAELDGYIVCDGSLSEKTLTKEKHKYFMQRTVIAGSDISDLSLYNAKEDTFLIVSSKNYRHYTIDHLDIADISYAMSRNYPDEKFKMGFMVSDRTIIENMEVRSNKYMKADLDKSFIFDWANLEAAFARFKECFTIDDLMPMFYEDYCDKIHYDIVPDLGDVKKVIYYEEGLLERAPCKARLLSNSRLRDLLSRRYTYANTKIMILMIEPALFPVHKFSKLYDLDQLCLVLMRA